MDDALEDGAVLVEWPERGFPARLAADALTITLTQTGTNAREARIDGPAALATSHRRRQGMNFATDARREAMTAFLAESGWGKAELKPLPGDASTRRYIRLHMGGRSAMLMDQPQHAEAPTAGPDATPEARRALGYNALARLAGADCGRFVATARYLKSCGLAAPEILAADVAQGFLVLEDLGDDLYTDVIAAGGNERAMYQAAIEALGAASCPACACRSFRRQAAVPLRRDAMLAEVDLLTEWFLPLALKRPAHADLADEHRALWRDVLHDVGGARVFVHRDFHAQNLLWRAGQNGLGARRHRRFSGRARRRARLRCRLAAGGCAPGRGARIGPSDDGRLYRGEPR